MSHDVNARRQFLRQATTITWGAMTLTILPAGLADGEATEESAGSGSAPADRPPVFAFLVDAEKCMGSGKCLTACRVENDVPEGYVRTWVERYVHYSDGRIEVDLVPETGYVDSGIEPIDPADVVRAYFVPKLCNQCEEAPCNQVCPVHASVTAPEGVELVDGELCIGCGYCVQACPYSTRFINPETHNADKCTWCYHRILRGELPACVEACPVDARLFGRLDDPESEISKRIAAIPTDVLRPHLGTRPRTRYVGISDDVV
jgi:Fe-S-cluster-containing dehydrogenase component